MSPLEQFEIFPLINFFFVITNSSIFFLVGFLFLFIFFFISIKIIPTRLQQIFEVLYKNAFELSYLNIGPQARYFFPLIFVLFFFILFCNLLGMIPYSFTLTSHLIVTFSLSFFLYLGFNWMGLQTHKISFLNLLLPSGASIYLVPLLVPLELVSYLFRAISLPVRLFANMMAGHTLLKVIAGFAWTMIHLGWFMVILHFVPLFLLVLLFGLEIGVAFIQAYVFTILTCMYIHDALLLH